MLKDVLIKQREMQSDYDRFQANLSDEIHDLKLHNEKQDKENDKFKTKFESILGKLSNINNADFTR